MLRRLLTQLAFLEEEIASFDRQIAEATAPFAAMLTRLDGIPGVARRAAENLLAEVGPDMTPFATAAHLVSWAAICPGQHESAGRSHAGTIRKGNRWLRRTLGQAAWSAHNKKNSYAGGRSFADSPPGAGASGPSSPSRIVSWSAVYYIIRDDVEYHDLGAAHFDRLAPDRLTRMLVKRLERLGHKVTLEAAA